MSRNIYIDNMPQEKALQLFMDELQSCVGLNARLNMFPVRKTLHRITAERSCQTFFASLCGLGHGRGGSKIGHDNWCHGRQSHQHMVGDFLEVDTVICPQGYDAVIMIEDINFFPDHIQIIKAAVPWQHIRSIGEDMVVVI